MIDEKVQRDMSDFEIADKGGMYRLPAFYKRDAKGDYIKSAKTGKKRLFAANGKDWSAMQAKVFSLTDLGSIDARDDPDYALRESAKRDLEGVISALTAPVSGVVGKAAGKIVGGLAARGAIAAGTETAAEGVTRGGIQESLAGLRAAAGQTIRQRGAAAAGTLVEMQPMQAVAAGTAVETLGTGTGRAATSAASLVARGGVTTAFAASRAKRINDLEFNDNEASSTLAGDGRRPINPSTGGGGRRPINPPIKPPPPPIKPPSTGGGGGRRPINPPSKPINPPYVPPAPTPNPRGTILGSRIHAPYVAPPIPRPLRNIIGARVVAPYIRPEDAEKIVNTGARIGLDPNTGEPLNYNPFDRLDAAGSMKKLKPRP